MSANCFKFAYRLTTIYQRMKEMKHITVLALSATTLFLTGSCSLLNKTTNAIKGTDGRVTTPAENTTTVKQPIIVLPDSVAGKYETVKEQPKSQATVATDSATVKSAGDFTINGEWTIYSVRNTTVTGEERPYITFDLAAKRFYGSNGCNVINGDVITDGTGALKIDNFITTMRMCHDDQYSYLINQALADVAGYEVRQEGSITFLDLKNAAKQTVLVLRRHNMDFLNGAWRVVTLNGTPLTGEAKEATLVVNIPDRLVHGTTGCNIYNGHLFIDPDKRRSMQFADLATTRMLCPPDSRETEFLLALEEVETGRLTGVNTASLCNQDGKCLFTLERIDLPKDE